MKDKVEIGLIRCGEIAMYLREYAELMEMLKKRNIGYNGYEDIDRVRKLSEKLYADGEAIAEALNAEYEKNKA